MSTRANWHFELLVDDSEAPVEIEQDGEPVFILDDVATLRDRLGDAMNRVEAISNSGTACSLMFTNGVTCSACPIRRTRPDDPMSALCASGIEVERVETTLAIRRARPEAG